MRIVCDARGFYWVCLTCRRKGRHTDTRENAVKRGEAHIREHRQGRFR